MKTLMYATLAAIALLGFSGCGEGGPQSNSTPPIEVPEVPGGPPTANTGGVPSVEEIMETLNQGRNSATKQIGAALQSASPDWDMLQSKMPEYVRLAKALGRNEPPTGPKISWNTLTAAFATSAVALDEAVKGKNREAAIVAHKALGSSCKACHDMHKPKSH